VVSCRTATGEPIQCCGHGLLCSASLWLERWQSPGVLAACGADIACLRENDTVWIGLPAVPCEPVPTPRWLPVALQGLDADTVLACAGAGPEDGYLVVEMPRDYDLAAITPPGANLAADTGRALIVTCAVSTRLALYDEQVQFRYFAPQYGVVEDAATGSAMRVLARYWQALDSELVALQLSPARGYLRARLDGDRAWVGGHVSSITQGIKQDITGDTARHG
jgi:predicted PhzF superfamily epimerase YddE/YHI9